MQGGTGLLGGTLLRQRIVQVGGNGAPLRRSWPWRALPMAELRLPNRQRWAKQT